MHSQRTAGTAPALKIALVHQLGLRLTLRDEALRSYLSVPLALHFRLGVLSGRLPSEISEYFRIPGFRRMPPTSEIVVPGSRSRSRAPIVGIDLQTGKTCELDAKTRSFAPESQEFA